MDQKWRLLQWDGDALAFMNYNVVTRVVCSGPDVLVPEDLHDDYAARLQSTPNSLLMDLVPHEYLKFHPRYRAAFERRLRELYPPAPATKMVSPGVCELLQGNILKRIKCASSAAGGNGGGGRGKAGSLRAARLRC